MSLKHVNYLISAASDKCCFGNMNTCSSGEQSHAMSRNDMIGRGEASRRDRCTTDGHSAIHAENSDQSAHKDCALAAEQRIVADPLEEQVLHGDQRM